MDSNANLTAFTQAAVRKIDTHEETFSINKIPNDLFAPFAIAAMVLLVLAMLCSTEWRKSRGLPLLLFLSCMVPQLHAAPLAEYATAYSQGLAHMKANEHDKAKEAFSRALLDEDTALQAAAHYQLGQINAARSFDELRMLYGEAAMAEGIEDEETQPQSQVSPEALQKIVDSLKQDITSYRDALKLQPSLTRAQKNIASIETLIKKLEEEIERLKQQQQQNQQDQQQNDQNQQQNQDKQEQKDNQQNQDADKQDKDEQQDKDSDKKQDPQDKQDQQGQDDQQQQQPEDKQDNGQQQDKEQQQQQAPKQQEEQPQPSDEEKARQYAASVLRSHLDEEKGSPIPHADAQVRPPDKDY